MTLQRHLMIKTFQEKCKVLKDFKNDINSNNVYEKERFQIWKTQVQTENEKNAY